MRMLSVFLFAALCHGQAIFRSQNIASGGGGSCGATYGHCASFVIPQQPSTLTDFPVPMLGLSQWALSGGGGQVINATTQTGGGSSFSVPADLIVALNSCPSTTLPFEWDRYDGVTATNSLLWGKATLSSSTATTIMACWGASGVTTWQGNVNGTWNSNFKGVYHFPNGSALSEKDSTSTGCDGTPVNSPTAVGGQIDGAVNLVSSSSQSVTLSCSQPILDPATNPFTLSAWVNIPGGSFASIVGNTTFNGTLNWRIESDNTVTLISQGVALICQSLTPLTTSTWHHIAVSYNNAICKFYLDGAVDRTVSVSTVISGGGSNVIGNDTGVTPFNGKIDDLRFSIGLRSDDWIAAEYASGHAPASWYTVTVIQ